VGRELQVELLQKTELNAVKIWKQEKKKLFWDALSLLFFGKMFMFLICLSPNSGYTLVFLLSPPFLLIVS
jgi:hypothetical protein